MSTNIPNNATNIATDLPIDIDTTSVKTSTTHSSMTTPSSQAFANETDPIYEIETLQSNDSVQS